MRNKRPPRRQRLLNRKYGDWFKYAKEQIDKGSTLSDVAETFSKYLSRYNLSLQQSTLCKWMSANTESEVTQCPPN
jgi:inhibitor of KinA sporulation pathway (predicted exonuclease)